jgi:hypothetical protein
MPFASRHGNKLHAIVEPFEVEKKPRQSSHAAYGIVEVEHLTPIRAVGRA